MRPSSATAAPASPELAERVKSRRGAAGLSQRQLAERVGLSREAVQNWELAKSGITWESLDRLAQALDCSPDWLRLGDEGLEAIVDARRRGPQPAAVRAAQGVEEIRQLLSDPPTDSGAFVVTVLRDIQGRLERIEAALGPATPSADDPPPAPGGVLGRRLRERETTEQDPNAPGSARGKDSRRGSA